MADRVPILDKLLLSRGFDFRIIKLHLGCAEETWLKEHQEGMRDCMQKAIEQLPIDVYTREVILKTESVFVDKETREITTVIYFKQGQ